MIVSASVYGQGVSPTDLREYVVTAETANLRQAPNTTARILGVVRRNDTVLVYKESDAPSGWLKVYRENENDAYIADYLVEPAPMRFYSPLQEPVATLSGRGNRVTDSIELPAGAYRVDAAIQDNSFILKTLVLEGNCRDSTLLNELDFNTNRLTLSTLLISRGCTLLFSTENVSGNWQIEVRDLLDETFLLATTLQIQDETVLSGKGHNLTMATLLPAGIWSLTAAVEDRAFILRAHVLLGDCDDTAVFNELDLNARRLEAQTIYRNTGGEACVIFWETDNVDGEWEVVFDKLR